MKYCLDHAGGDRARLPNLAQLAVRHLRSEPVLAAAALHLAPQEGAWFGAALLSVAAASADRLPLTRFMRCAWSTSRRVGTTRGRLDVARLAGTMGRMETLDGLTLVEHYGAGEGSALRRELVDGVLIVSAMPSMRHQIAVQRLNEILVASCSRHLLVVGSINVDREPATNLQPDLNVVRLEDIDLPPTVYRPVLTVEVLSPSTRRFDLTVKRQIYAELGIPSYWIVDISEPSVTILELANGEYAEVQRLVGDMPQTVEQPFAVTFAAADLTRVT